MKRRSYVAVAEEAARKAGKLLMASYGKLKLSQIAMKSKNDFVTELDRRSEKLVVSVIKKYYPGHSIQAEEGGLSRGKSALWIIDPLDGTSNYIHQFPMFSVSIAAADADGLQAGVVYDPVHDELFSAEKGKGAFLNGRRIRVSAVAKLADALMATGIPFRARERFDEYMRSFRSISLGSVGLRRGGSAALDLAYVACGRFDGFWEMDLSPWDIAAGAVLIREAGGKITDLWGGADPLKNGDTLATNKKIHAQLEAITKPLFTPVTTDKRCRFI